MIDTKNICDQLFWFRQLVIRIQFKYYTRLSFVNDYCHQINQEFNELVISGKTHTMMHILLLFKKKKENVHNLNKQFENYA